MFLGFLVFCFCMVLFLTGVSGIMLSLFSGKSDRHKLTWSMEMTTGPPTQPGLEILEDYSRWPLKMLLPLTHPSHGAGFVVAGNPTVVWLGAWDQVGKATTSKTYARTEEVLADGWSIV